MSQGNSRGKVVNIPPPGGTLVNRLAGDAERPDLLAKAASLPCVQVLLRERCDLAMLAIGAYSPLTDFMAKPDDQRVVKAARLATGRGRCGPMSRGVSPAVPAEVHAGQDVAPAYELGHC